MYDSILSHRITINMGANVIPSDLMGTLKIFSRHPEAPPITLDLGGPDCGVPVLQVRLSRLRPNNRFTHDSTHHTLFYGAPY